MKNSLRFLFFIAAILSFGLINGQGSVLKGTVRSSDDGETLNGVRVQLKGTSEYAVTNLIGEYELKLPSVADVFFTPKSPPPVLIFSLDGFEPVEIQPGGKTLMDIELKPIQAPDFMIESGTAAGLESKNMCFSVAQVSALPRPRPPAPYFGLDLQARIPGLRVQQPGGQPGQAAYFQIRSANALANGQQPLVIMDGIYLNGTSLADLNPDDIEKVEILKGSAGSSLYGSRAANGVIEIFTKRGNKLEVGDTKVTYRGEAGFSKAINRYPVNEFTNREIIDPDGPQPVLGNTHETGIFDIPLPNLQDYQEDILFRRGAFQEHFLGVQAHSGATNFYASAQRFRDEGILQANDAYTRNTFRLNLDHELSSKFNLSISSMYAGSGQDLPDPGLFSDDSYLHHVLALTPIFGLEAPNEENGAAYDWDIDNTGMGGINPLYYKANSTQSLNRNRLMGSFGASYLPSDWLSFHWTAALDKTNQRFSQFLEKGFLSSKVPGLFGSYATAGVQQSNGGGIFRSELDNRAFISNIKAVIKKEFSGFNTAIQGSFLYEDFSEDLQQSSGENLIVAGIQSLDNTRDNRQTDSRREEIVAYSGFLVADVDYKKKYLFSGLFRKEQSSLFGPEEDWADYYRVAGAYRITEDIKLRMFQELKLRAAVGTAGIRPLFEQRFETYDLSGGNLVKNTLGNRMLKPARAQETEVGVNAKFWRAFDLEFNYVKAVTEDQILLAPLSGAAGFSAQWRNAGVLEAKIYEASLGIDMSRLFRMRNKDLYWNISASFDKMEQTVTRLDIPAYNTGPSPETAYFRIEEGGSFGAMTGHVFATDPSQLDDQEGINPADYTLNAAGYLVRVDQIGTPDERPYLLLGPNGDPKVETIGDINPKFRMGFSHTFAYKGFQLYALFDWKKGGQIYNRTRQTLYLTERHGDFSAYPDITGGFFQALYDNGIANNHFVEDGSYFMLREASVSFNIGKEKLTSLFKGALENIRISIIGRNLFTSTRYSGFHPDVSSLPGANYAILNPGSQSRTTPLGDPSLFTVDNFNYPQRQSVSLSLELGF